jgi:hypothetical protein
MNNSAAKLEEMIKLVKELRPDFSANAVKEHAMKLLTVQTRGGKRKTHRRRKAHRKTRRHHRK